MAPRNFRLKFRTDQPPECHDVIAQQVRSCDVCHPSSKPAEGQRVPSPVGIRPPSVFLVGAEMLIHVEIDIYQTIDGTTAVVKPSNTLPCLITF